MHFQMYLWTYSPRSPEEPRWFLTKYIRHIGNILYETYRNLAHLVTVRWHQHLTPQFGHQFWHLLCAEIDENLILVLSFFTLLSLSTKTGWVGALGVSRVASGIRPRGRSCKWPRHRTHVGDVNNGPRIPSRFLRKMFDLSATLCHRQWNNALKLEWCISILKLFTYLCFKK